MKKHSSQFLYSPSDLVRYLKSPFASWMDRYYLENPGAVIPDEETEDERLIAQTGDQHERTVLEELRASHSNLVEVPKRRSCRCPNNHARSDQRKGPHHLPSGAGERAVRWIQRISSCST